MTTESPYLLKPVSIEGCGKTYGAYIREGENWNGFACPYFPLDEALRLAKDVKNNPWFWGTETTIDYNESTQEFKWTLKEDPQEDTPEEYYYLKPISLKGKGGRTKIGYPLGSWGWCWQVVDAPSTTQLIKPPTYPIRGKHDNNEEYTQYEVPGQEFVIVVQSTGLRTTNPCWYIYKVYPGPKGVCNTLDYSYQRKVSEEYAESWVRNFRP